jgi:hypothetical protein
LLTEILREAYQFEDQQLRERVWRKSPFRMMSPDMDFLSFRDTNHALDNRDRDFFLRYVRNNFFPDKSLPEAGEAMIHAMNRGINSLNISCRRFFPGGAQYFFMMDIPLSFDPLEGFLEARNIFRRESPKRNRGDVEAIFRAYDLIRAWGIGHFVLMIDEDPITFDSVIQGELIENWMNERMGFSNPSTPDAQGEVSWQTEAGVRVYGTEESPFRHRAKIYDEKGHIRYGSIMTKMFLGPEFLNQTHDTYGVEFVVGSDEDANRLVEFFSYEARGTGALERFKHIEDPGPPAFFRRKFVLRVPIKVSRREAEHIEAIIEGGKPQPGTLRAPLTRYKRIPVEIQIRDKTRPYEHELYKRLQYGRVFPLFYPKRIYEPLLKRRSGNYLLK